MAEATQDNELDLFFGPRTQSQEVGGQGRLGVVISGSLADGLDVKLERTVETESLAVGRYVVVQGRGGRKFFGMVTDVALDAANPEFARMPPNMDDDFLREVYAGTGTFGRIHITPQLILEEGSDEPKPVKTIPAHFSPAYSAGEDDVNRVFSPQVGITGGAAGKKYFHVGQPLDMEQIKINLDLARVVERSSGVFGKSGTGKTFLSRLLLAGVIQQDAAVNLIFDMHNEYGWEGTSEGSSKSVKGLKQLFNNQVQIFTLDEDSSRRRRAKYDAAVQIGYDQIEPEDLESLQELMNLSDPGIQTAFALQREYGSAWLQKFLEADAEELNRLVEKRSQNASVLNTLRRRLGLFERFKFLVPNAVENSVRKIIDLLQDGRSVVLEFGRYGSSLEAYILVANYLTRRIHGEYVQRKERAMGDKEQEPRQLVITIEEAHKFLEPRVAHQTIFGTIARELRKYNVTLFIVDQRPSGIDTEVMSQIGTRVTCLLDNEEDIKAVLTGISGAGELRQVLARLDTRQQALILGHAVPMPVVVQTRAYDMDFYKAMGYREGDELTTVLNANRRLLRSDSRSRGLD